MGIVVPKQQIVEPRRHEVLPVCDDGVPLAAITRERKMGDQTIGDVDYVDTFRRTTHSPPSTSSVPDVGSALFYLMVGNRV